jgi:hypothetical protein
MRLPAMVTAVVALAASSAFAADYGGSLVVGAPKGALDQAADVAGGLAGHALFSTRSGALALRLDGSWLIYGSQTVRLPIAGTAGRLVREITTDNWMADAAVGPQIVVPVGAARPYINAFAGVSYMSTTSHLRDPNGFVSAESTNYDDTGFSYGAGGGILVPLKGGGTLLDLGVRYVRTETMTFLGEGDLDGAGVAPRPHRGQANVLEFRLGLVFSSRSHPPHH